MRVAHLMAGAPAGGAELFFERLCLAAHHAGDAILPVTRPDPARLARLAAGGLTPVTLRFGGPLDLATGPRLRRLLRDNRPDIAVAWMSRAARFAPRGPWALAGRLGGQYDLRRYRRCTDLIANTKNLAAWIAAQGWPPARIHHLPNFVSDLAGAAPATLPTPPDTRTILAAGRLHPNKAFDTLLSALALIPRAHLVLAGDGPERATLEQQAARQNLASRVYFLGWRTDTASLLAACDVFVCPSRHEPLGNVVLEAFSAARPVVATAAAGPTELIRPGQTGLLVPVDDPQTLARAIARLLDDPGEAARLAQAARSDYEQHHSPGTVLAQWREGLAHIVAAQRSHA